MDVFTAVADPNRRTLMELLRQRERPAGELVAALPRLTQPAVSRHLRVLREARLVSSRADGQRRVYRLEPTGFAEIERWLRHYQAFWTQALDALHDHLEQPAAKRGDTP
ncbi:MAG: ArsR/SmtB family transcription factor [Nocardioidaceae bacterium]